MQLSANLPYRPLRMTYRHVAGGFKTPPIRLSCSLSPSLVHFSHFLHLLLAVKPPKVLYFQDFTILGPQDPQGPQQSDKQTSKQGNQYSRYVLFSSSPCFETSQSEVVSRFYNFKPTNSTRSTTK